MWTCNTNLSTWQWQWGRLVSTICISNHFLFFRTDTSKYDFSVIYHLYSHMRFFKAYAMRYYCNLLVVPLKYRFLYRNNWVDNILRELVLSQKDPRRYNYQFYVTKIWWAQPIVHNPRCWEWNQHWRFGEDSIRWCCFGFRMDFSKHFLDEAYSSSCICYSTLRNKIHSYRDISSSCNNQRLKQPLSCAEYESLN